MLYVGRIRWPLILGLPLAAGAALFGLGKVQPRFEIQSRLVSSDNSKERTFVGHGVTGKAALQAATLEAQSALKASIADQKMVLHREMDGFQKQAQDSEALLARLTDARKAAARSPKRKVSHSDLLAQIILLKNRRQLLIQRYPTHTDIAFLAKKIKDLQTQMSAPVTGSLGPKLEEIDRQLNEAKLRHDYFVRRAQELALEEESVKPAWRMILPLAAPKWPKTVDGWPIGAGAMGGLFIFGLVLFKGERRLDGSAANGLWRPEGDALSDHLSTKAEEPPASPSAEAAALSEPLPAPPPKEVVSLQVISPDPAETKAVVAAPEPEVPSDPVTQKAAELYKKWIELTKVLYTPSPEPPQGILDQVGPLMQESSDFLPQGHEVLARYLAKSVTPGDLPAHVARTVLMTLTSAQEAGVSPEHRLAMALAALFHDLAVVPRPAPVQENTGSEVGRLSASVLKRIPGVPPALMSMVEDILVGMDEYKLETWHNAALGKSLEPLSKVLREIDRFEKVMQKQKARLDRQLTKKVI